jgi:GNAT superfamily N-acetyltransferase
MSMISEPTWEQVSNFRTINGSALNYTDFLQTREDIACYRFIGYTQNGALQGIAGISPNNDFSIYSNKPIVSEMLLNEALSLEPRPSAIFGDDFMKSCLAERTSSIPIGRHEKIMYLSKTCSRSRTLSNTNAAGLALSQSIAGPSDQSLVNHWYTIYNEREGTNWQAPDLSIPNGPRLFLTYLDGQFANGCANSLKSTARLWIGRLFTLPNFRRRGIASWTMDKIEYTALSERKSVDLLVFKTNEAALRFYQRRGYNLRAVRGYWQIAH